MRTKVYYTINGAPQYNEFDGMIPCSFKDSKNEVIQLRGYLLENIFGYKFCKDDGPAVVYNSGDLVFQSSKCNDWISMPSFEKCLIEKYKLSKCIYSFLYNWSINTNHILCNIYNLFCKQQCFI